MADWVTNFIETWGLGAVALLMLLENIFPPLPSELIMPFAGFAAEKGDMNIVLVALAGAAGSVAGALVWYAIGRYFGMDRLRRWTSRHGSWLAMSPGDVDKADHWFDSRGRRAVFFGRLVPAVRTLISVPAGMFGMPLPEFLVWTSAGSLLWCGALAGAGYVLSEKFERASGLLNTATHVILAVLVVAYVWRVVKLRRRERQNQPAR